jgi:hypothetical protein
MGNIKKCTMKQKYIYLILLYSQVFSLCSCNNSHQNTTCKDATQDTIQLETKSAIENIFIDGEKITGNYSIITERYSRYDYSIVKSNGFYGLINDSNRIVLPIVYDSIWRLQFGDYFFITKDSLIGIVTYNGDLNVPIIYEHIEYDWKEQKTGEEDGFIVQKNKKLGSIDYFNNIIIPIEFDGISNWVEYGPNAHYIKKDSLYGLINYNSGHIIIPPIYQFVGFWSNNCITVRKNRKFGLMNINNETVIPIKYDKLHLELDYGAYGTNSKDRVYVEKDGVWLQYNLDGKLIKKDVIIERFYDYDLTDELPLNANDHLMVLPSK